MSCAWTLSSQHSCTLLSLQVLLNESYILSIRQYDSTSAYGFGYQQTHYLGFLRYSGFLSIPFLVLTTSVIGSKGIARISSGDYSLVVILGRLGRLGWSVSIYKNSIPLRSTTEMRAFLNEQLVQSDDGRVIVPGDKINRWIRCSHVINEYDYINVFILRHNILTRPAWSRRAKFPNIHSVSVFGYPTTTMIHISEVPADSRC